MKYHAWSYDKDHVGRLILGADEVGVGALSGPIVATAVVLRAGLSIPGLKDSKKMTEGAREAALPQIQAEALCWFTAWTGSAVVDRMGMHASRLQILAHCVQRAAEMLAERTSEEALIVVDGDQRLAVDLAHLALPKGDDKCIAVAGAATIAKVTRDRFMHRIAKEFPMYDWPSNKGYGTPKHIASIDVHGISPHHRQSLTRRTLRRYRAKRESGQ